MLNSCHPHRLIRDQILLLNICSDTIADFVNNQKDILSKSTNDEFCVTFVEGRDRVFGSYEELACLLSTKLHSKFNYKTYCFIYKDRINDFISFFDSFLPHAIKRLNINIVPIELIDNREKLSDFMINKMVFLLGEEHKYYLNVQPDGFLIKRGWEDFYLGIGCPPFIGCHWQHSASILAQEPNTKKWFHLDGKSVNLANGGFSLRDIKSCRIASITLNGVTLAECGREDFAKPPEDLYFCFTLYSMLGYNKPSLEDCRKFSLDPINRTQYLNGDSFGFHCPVATEQI